MAPPFSPTMWYRALPLAERIGKGPEAQKPPRGQPTELARRLLQRWRSQSPFKEADWFRLRLEQVGLSEQELLLLLDVPEEGLSRWMTPRPAWVEEWEAVLARDEAQPRRLLPDEPELVKKVDGFLYLIEPLLAHALRQAQVGVEELLARYPGAPLDVDSGVQVLSEHLPQRLFSLVQRTLLLELQVARLQGVLEGETPDARFASFVRRLREPRVRRELLEEYAVLSRQLLIEVRRWLAAGLEFLERLCRDWPALRDTFQGAAASGTLVSARESGDLHEGGRSVRLLEFDSGLRLVYKPRSLSVDVHFQQLLAWLNARGGCLPLRGLKVLDRATYGWTEFVASAPCQSVEQVRRFYERQGSFLALLHVLCSTDMHYENLIASGEDPLLVDLESLFHPNLAREEEPRSQVLAGRLVSSSVLRVSLLPQRVWAQAGNGHTGMDISGLEARPGQLNAERSLYWQDEGADTMRVARRRDVFEGGKNRPTLQGSEVTVLEHTEDFLAGFTRMYRLLMEHRAALLADDGPLACFATDRTRVLLRHTRAYAKLLEESFHPDVLREAVERDRLFDRLWFGIERAPELRRIIPSEHEALWSGDVPCFTTRPGSRDLWDNVGRRIEGFLAEPGLELVRRHVAQLSEEELTRQLWFIRASLRTLESEHQAKPGPYRLVTPPRPPSPEQLVGAAECVAERLEVLALRAKEDAAWIGLTPALTVEPLWVDLYGGTPGISLFLAYLGAITGKARYSELGHAAWRNVRRQLEARERPCTSVGAFNGLGGILYVLSHLRSLWGEPDLGAEAERVLEALEPLIDKDDELDLLGGCAGCILALGVLRRAMPELSERALELAVRCGERLLSAARRLPEGLGWSGASSPRPLSGLAHGAAGYALALEELAKATRDLRFREAALASLEYERGLFSREAGNWRDLRDPRLMGAAPGEILYSMGWCHGAPGIGLSRLCLLDSVDDEALRTEIAVALETTSAHGFGMSHSLCHGDLGNLELLVKASQTLEDREHWRQRSLLLAGAILRSIQESGWRCGNPSKLEEPGLMTGLAGIGYGLLRLADPLRVPCVLALEPPSEARTAARWVSSMSRTAAWAPLT